ncbi:MAG: DUF3887 domain-containing protein [Methanosarcinales archaeon]|nr:MAG: DUF3887 domain-containing protein [Methanosarcinales archaeon]
MEKITVSGLMVVVTIAAVVMLAGCVEENPVYSDQVRAYADPITENILSGMNENNYSRYAGHFDQTMKTAMNEAVFNETNMLVRSKIGDYVSKEFLKVESKNQYTVVHYNARFTDEPEDVTVRVVFQEVMGEMKVSGLWLDSPILREK